MAILIWLNPNTERQAFTLEFDESVVESEFSELVYGLIENANGDAHRQNETIASQRDCIISLRKDIQDIHQEWIKESKECEAREADIGRDLHRCKLLLQDITTLEFDKESKPDAPDVSNATGYDKDGIVIV